MYDVFISYSSKDQKIAEGICAYLEQRHIRCFVAYRDIPKGVVWAKAITEALDASRMMVVVFSKNFNVSEQVDREIELAAEDHKPILTFRLSNDAFEGAKKYYLKNLNWIDAFPHPDACFGKLSEEIEKLLGPPMGKVDVDESGLQRSNTLEPSVLPLLKIKADLDCVFYLDGEERSHLKAGIIQKFPLAPGEYELMFVGVENESDRVEMELEMPEADKLQKVYLKDVRDSRLKKEAEARRAAEEKRVAEEKRRAEEQRQAELRRQEAERKAAEERKREEERKRREAEEQRRREEEERKRREEEARAKERVFKVGNVEFKMIRVEGGTFQMGSSEDDIYWQPVHSVTLSGYSIGETEVTQALWEAVMGNNPSKFKGADLPVERVSWDDCQDFIRELNRQTGQNFRLPTEAEWEFAARGGNRSRGTKYAGSNDISTVAWYEDNSGSRTHPVKGKSPNELGLYDMSGNVWEWCEDWYDSSYYSSSPQTNPKGPASGSNRVIRGGSWINNAAGCRVAIRFWNTPFIRYNSLGLRLAL